VRSVVWLLFRSSHPLPSPLHVINRTLFLRTSALVLSLLTTTLATTAVGQRSLVLPQAFDRAWGRGSSAALGGSSTRTQMVFASPFPLGTVVLGFGLRNAVATADRAAFTADIEVRASSTPNAPGALSATFASNVGSDEVVVVPRQIVNIAPMPANRSTGVFATIPFATPFTYGTNLNTNMMVDLLVYGRSAGASWSTDRCFTSASGTAANAGIGCGTATISSTSTGGTYVSGSTTNFTLAAATANSIAWLMPSVDLKELVPGLMLPFSLTGIGGGAGCDLMVNPITLIPAATSGTGTASVSFPISFSVGTGWQWLYLVAPSATNPIGLESTAVRKIFYGPEVCTGIGQYVWDLSNVNNATGNNTTDSVPVVVLLIQ
jgi:hypothetical protein